MLTAAAVTVRGKRINRADIADLMRVLRAYDAGHLPPEPLVEAEIRIEVAKRVGLPKVT